MLWVATSYGVFKSIDGGDNWTNKQSGSFRDLKVKPNNSNIILIISKLRLQQLNMNASHK